MPPPRSTMEDKLKKGRSLLFSRDSDCLRELIGLIGQQKHRTLVRWAFDCVQRPLHVLETRYPDEPRPRQCLTLCEQWAGGVIKMPAAKRAILDVHALAKELEDKADIALCHAIGQGCATVHVETHAVGLAFYELTAIAREAGPEQAEAAVQRRIDDYRERLLYWQEHIDEDDTGWAAFLLDDSRPNKERLLNEKLTATNG